MAQAAVAQPAPATDVRADFVRQGPPQAVAPPLADALARLNAAAIGAHVALLASPALEGRGLGQRGLDVAGEYVATSLALAGIAPLVAGRSTTGATGAYFHAVPIRQITNPRARLVVEVQRPGALDARTFLAGVDGEFPQIAPETFSAAVVFAGYGIREASPARDDYRDLDVRGRIVVVLDGVPDGAAWQTPDLVRRYAGESPRQRHAAKRALARSLGARAVIVIEGEAFAAGLAARAGTPAAAYFVPMGEDEDARTPLIRVSSRAGTALFGDSGLTLATAGGTTPMVVPMVAVRVELDGDERLVHGRNVIGVIEGRDPQLAREAVVIGAHYDHLGRVEGVVHPGADDNASGTASLLEIARAFAASPQRPARTVVFAFWTGEEEGHFGSEHYVAHPLWPLERTVAYLNLDMIGHPWTAGEIRTLLADTKYEGADELLKGLKPEDFLEVGLAEWAPEIAPVLARAARATGVALHIDRGAGTSGGSDYRAFARARRPWLRFFGNYFDAYHEPGDTAEKLDPAQVLKMARLALATAWHLAH
jgi:hypothetical protein